MYPTLPIVKQPVANSNIAQAHNSLFIRFLFFIRFLTKETLYLKSLFLLLPSIAVFLMLFKE
ncbi:hypothetical protein LEP1GSC083_2794 [Leptospira interrogans serovar Pyrogenes str. L0374]|uniref:Uncharacterized protein n=4 Tax=Leptospira interrogans TaxID=173 RepID=M6ZU94_LEPIR|nr:hypothetical protein LEP1GSC075_2456 [Leptospira interrogans str. Kito]EMM97109.1 hypothetical protein LEP1GSC158_3350 [Leptospira interrogans serovar Zanoni str. LT2156]EMN32898.1 hypothetical protein LEP1GSC083_2794 [Leptospira interrogans serovar Pyrogenes str. L0374]EMP09651.1 hypothetical protein LEP1GSC124_5087 [Leptospira interrogans serovar Pyrogenes str. 200701872]